MITPRFKKILIMIKKNVQRQSTQSQKQEEAQEETGGKIVWCGS